MKQVWPDISIFLEGDTTDTISTTVDSSPQNSQ
jgi:hypothetical protein